jgi:hypothetical protein
MSPNPRSLWFLFRGSDLLVHEEERGARLPGSGDINTLEDAGWFGVDDLPGLPSPLSIARALVDDFIARRKT